MKKSGIFSATNVLWKVGNLKDKLSFIGLLILSIVRGLTDLIVPLIIACIISKLSGESAENFF